MVYKLTGILGPLLLLALPGLAQSDRISENLDVVDVMINGSPISIGRSGAPCPPACVQPMQAAPGVTTAAELEVIEFLEQSVTVGLGLLVDVRVPEQFATGSLPGAVNVPHATLKPTNSYRNDLLSALGMQNGDFSAAYELLVFGNGATDSQATEAIRHLLDAGYPADKLIYYRGGIASWTSIGLTVSVVN